MNGYSKDLRLRVLMAVDRGTSRVEIVRLFGVSLVTIGRYVKRRRETGEIAYVFVHAARATLLLTKEKPNTCHIWGKE